VYDIELLGLLPEMLSGRRPEQHWHSRDRWQRCTVLVGEKTRHRGATLVTSQLPVDRWHEIIGDPTLADAILDRIVHNAHRLKLCGGSLRKKTAVAVSADGRSRRAPAAETKGWRALLGRGQGAHDLATGSGQLPEIARRTE